MSERSTGGSTSTFDATRIQWCYCIRIDMPSPVGTKRFTDGGPAGDVVDNIDGTGSQTWSQTIVETGDLSQGQQVLAVSNLAFANLDGQWATWNKTVRLINTPVSIWTVFFDPDSHAIANIYKSYEGRIDNRQIGDYAELVLKPHHAEWTREMPTATPMELGASELMPDPATPPYFGDQLKVGRVPPMLPVQPRVVVVRGK